MSNACKIATFLTGYLLICVLEYKVFVWMGKMNEYIIFHFEPLSVEEEL